jgi:hypothetical protein
VFPELQGVIEVQTSHNFYHLQGEITDVEGFTLEWIKVDGRKIETTSQGNGLSPGEPHIRVAGAKDTRDRVVFGALLPVPDCDQARPVEVEASFAERSTAVPAPNLWIRKMENSVWKLDSIYSVTLRSLEETPMRGKPPRRQQDQRVMSPRQMVLDAVQNCGWRDENDGAFHKRFQYRAFIDGGNAHVETDEPPGTDRRTSGEPVASLAEAGQNRVDLAIDGQIREEADRFEIKLQVVNLRRRGLPLFDKPIDIFGMYSDPQFCVLGLKAKLVERFPRPKVEILEALPDKRVEIGYGRNDNIYEDMQLGVYMKLGSKENPELSWLCEARVENVFDDQSDVRLDDRCNWNTVTTQLADICLISK